MKEDVNIKSSEGLTALEYAAEYGYLDVVKALVGRGATDNIENAIYLAHYYDHKEIEDYLKQL